MPIEVQEAYRTPNGITQEILHNILPHRRRKGTGATSEKVKSLTKAQQNNSWLLDRKHQSQKDLERCVSSPKRWQLSTQTTIPRKTIYKIEGEIKSFKDKSKVKEFKATESALQRVLEHMGQPEQKGKHVQEVTGGKQCRTGNQKVSEKHQIDKMTETGTHLSVITKYQWSQSPLQKDIDWQIDLENRIYHFVASSKHTSPSMMHAILE